jgi:hypothetical protein
VLRSCERLNATEWPRIDDAGAAVAVAVGYKDRGHVVADQCDVGAMCAIGDVQRVAGS